MNPNFQKKQRQPKNIKKKFVDAFLKYFNLIRVKNTLSHVPVTSYTCKELRDYLAGSDSEYCLQTMTTFKNQPWYLFFGGDDSLYCVKLPQMKIEIVKIDKPSSDKLRIILITRLEQIKKMEHWQTYGLRHTIFESGSMDPPHCLFVRMMLRKEYLENKKYFFQTSITYEKKGRFVLDKETNIIYYCNPMVNKSITIKGEIWERLSEILQGKPNHKLLKELKFKDPKDYGELYCIAWLSAYMFRYGKKHVEVEEMYSYPRDSNGRTYMSLKEIKTDDHTRADRLMYWIVLSKGQILIDQNRDHSNLNYSYESFDGSVLWCASPCSPGRGRFLWFLGAK